ncbi:hypothetical protein PRIPAC_75112 [Pristionchus pacificus]|uniref:Uncharacterized protein n=1 Tax=Pristionchus pacificus TaxID=54126 RepID=A0A2A6CFG4_PRIPA|nr:hypothetical protein PRIPAC_75112 [Pristionchus pacificus]|eukprot:PDM76856.1 hypothetical protein PRIPAC_42251 [Pristionchus pacificus]
MWRLRSREGSKDERICCCGRMSITSAADIVMSFSLVLIVFNLLMKAIGYSDTDWNWELLFLVVDSVAVLCLFFGIRRENAALLQPFVLLSLVTISFLLLLTIFFGTAVHDGHSYAGEYLEMELRENVQSYATLLSIQSKTVVPLIATVLTVGTGITFIVNCWFLQIVVQCARHFRKIDADKTSLTA